MSDSYQNFRNIVASSPVLRERWNSVTDAAIENAAREGIVVSREELLTLDSIRTHVVSGDAATGIAWRDEAERKIPAFTQKAESRRFLTAFKSNDADEKSKVEMELLRKNPTERMRIAREGGEATLMFNFFAPELGAIWERVWMRNIIYFQLLKGVPPKTPKISGKIDNSCTTVCRNILHTVGT